MGEIGRDRAFGSDGDDRMSERGITTLDMMLILVLLVVLIATAIPAYLSSRKDATSRECSLRLAVIQEAKRDVMKEMNLRLPRDQRLRITDNLNALHFDMISQLTLQSPWRFHPDDPCPGGATLSVGATFLEPPSSSQGHSIADLEALK